MLVVTDKAAEKLKGMLDERGLEGYGLRIGVIGGGCSGFQYRMEFDNAVKEGDEVIDSNGVKLYVDSRSLLYLAGTKIDYEEDMVGGGFKFVNPNATASCGCGQSFSA